MKKEKISIIVPVYNVEKYLEECIKSLVSQDYENYEILLIDDGSTDSSYKICQQYSRKYQNVRTYKQKNQGVSVARNKGIELSNGKWICFVDSDDYVDSKMLSTLYSIIKNEGCEIAITPPIMDFRQQKIPASIFGKKITFTKKNKQKLLLNIICRQYHSAKKTYIGAGGPWAKMYNREFLIKNQLTFKVGLQRMQDVIFNLYAMSLAKKVVYQNNFLYHYRINYNSSTIKFNKNIFITFSNVLEEMYKFDEKHELEEAIFLKTVLLYIEGSRIGIVHKDNPSGLFAKIKELKKAYQLKQIQKGFYNVKYCDLSIPLKAFVWSARHQMFLIVYIMITVFNFLKNREQE